MKFKRIDVLEINISDCYVDDSLKLKTTAGAGEWRPYVGHEEKPLDEFFEFENIEYFFLLKKDLLEYLEEAKIEYLDPTQDYREDITKLYETKLNEIKNIDEDVLKIQFRKTYDSQKRYYIVLERGVENRNKYRFLRNISLPRISKLMLVKLEEIKTKKKYIYMKPILYLDSDRRNLKLGKYFKKEEKLEVKQKIQTKEEKKKGREKQLTYRLSLLEKMPYCLITGVTEDRILQACHIKPYSVCEENEKYDVTNGLSMTPTYHKLFDLGFISFKNDGEILISPFMSNLNLNRLNLKNGKKYRLNKNCQKYLKFHREVIFNKINEDYLNL